MDKEFIPYEEALALKELGFDQECFGFYSAAKRLSIFYNTPYSSRRNSLLKGVLSDHSITAPLYQQAFRWFREKYGLSSYIGQWEDTKDFYVDIWHQRTDDGYHTYEEAELACLRKLIEIVKEKL